MQVNKAKYDPDNTYALMNAIGPNAILDASDPLLEHQERTYLSSLALFKAAFGRQQITVNYSHRNWVWTFTNGKATMHCLVNTTQGIAWEYNRATSDVDAILPLMQEIIRKLTRKRSKS